MTELLSHFPECAAQIQASNTQQSHIKLFAPHGGCIEPCTGVLVQEIAGKNLDYYIFHAMLKKNCFGTLHVTSTHYDEPLCREMIHETELAIAVHGCDENESFIFIGGGNAKLSSELLDYLKYGFNYPAVTAPGHMNGSQEKNFINMAKQKGIQIELSAGFRRLLFPAFPKTIQRHPTEFSRFVNSIRSWIHTTGNVLKLQRES